MGDSYADIYEVQEVLSKRNLNDVIINEGYVLDDQVVRSMENSLTLQLGLVFQYELAEEIKEFLYLLRSEINALELHKSGRKDHSNVRMGDDGPMMRKLMTTGLFSP